MKTKVLLWSLWVVAMLFVAVQPAKGERIRGIKSLRLLCSSDAIVNGLEIYELNCADDTTVVMKYFGSSNDDLKKSTVSSEQMKEIIDVLNKYEVQKWDGFREYDHQARGGDYFNFFLILDNGKKIVADGYEMYPPHYGDAINELIPIVGGYDSEKRKDRRYSAARREIDVPIPITIEEIKSLSFSTSGSTVNSGVMYGLTYGDGEYSVKIKHNGQSYDEAKTYPISDEQVEEIIDILNNYEVWRWNGFHEHDPDVYDGHSFHFTLTVQDGKTINAGGYMAYPENYGEVTDELLRIFNNLEEEHTEKVNIGNSGGILVPIIISAGALIFILLVLAVVRRKKKVSPTHLLWSVLLVVGLFAAVQPAMSQKIEGIKNLRFIFSSYSGVNNIQIYEVTCGYKYRVDIKREGNSFDKMSSRTLSDEEREKLIDLLNENEIWKWDGFRKFKPNKRLDHSFYFTLITYDDKTISANGYNAYPSNYIEVYSGLYDLFEGVDEKEEQCK